MKEEASKEQLEFMKLAIHKVRTMTQHLDNQINIIIGISTAVLVYSVSKFDSSQSIFFILLALFSGVATLIGLVAIHPFKFLRKRGGRDESITYNKKVTSFPEPEGYAKELMEFLKDPDKIMEDLAFDIYNTYKYYYQPKRKMYSITRNVFVAGIMVALIYLFFKYLFFILGI